MNKKADAMMPEALKKLIPIVIILVVLLYLVYSFLNGGEKLNEKNACKASVIEQANAKIMTSKLPADFSDVPLQCPTQIITIKETDTEKIKEQLALSMYECWDNFGRGDINIFPSERGAQEVFCVMCGDITFDKKDLQIPGFWDYLANNNPPLNNKETYLESFSKAHPTVADVADMDVKTGPIDTSKKYAVMYQYVKNVSFYDRWIGGTLGATAGVAIAVAAIIGAPFTAGTSLTLLAVAGAGAGGFFIGFRQSPELEQSWIATVNLLPIDAENPEMLKALKCTYIPVKP